MSNHKLFSDNGVFLILLFLTENEQFSVIQGDTYSSSSLMKDLNDMISRVRREEISGIIREDPTPPSRSIISTLQATPAPHLIQSNETRPDFSLIMSFSGKGTQQRKMKNMGRSKGKILPNNRSYLIGTVAAFLRCIWAAESCSPKHQYRKKIIG